MPLISSSISLTRLRLSILRRNSARVLGLGSLPLLWVKAAEADKMAAKRAEAEKMAAKGGPGPREEAHTQSNLSALDG